MLSGVQAQPIPTPTLPLKGREQSAFSPRRLLGYAYREALELRRDPIRLAFALLGSVLLMFVLGLYPRLVLDVINSTAVRMVEQLKF